VDDESVRPWGHYEVLSDGADFKAKTITVLPGKRLSYQRHAHRSEHWFVVRGNGVVTLDGRTVAVQPGAAVDVPVGTAHRIENTGEQGDLVFVEVQATRSPRTTSSAWKTTTDGRGRRRFPWWLWVVCGSAGRSPRAVRGHGSWRLSCWRTAGGGTDARPPSRRVLTSAAA